MGHRTDVNDLAGRLGKDQAVAGDLGVELVRNVVESAGLGKPCGDVGQGRVGCCAGVPVTVQLENQGVALFEVIQGCQSHEIDGQIH
ncbi:hypothetical protein [Desulfatiferula olefinivorans]